MIVTLHHNPALQPLLFLAKHKQGTGVAGEEAVLFTHKSLRILVVGFLGNMFLPISFLKMSETSKFSHN